MTKIVLNIDLNWLDKEKMVSRDLSGNLSLSENIWSNVTTSAKDRRAPIGLSKYDFNHGALLRFQVKLSLHHGLE